MKKQNKKDAYDNIILSYTNKYATRIFDEHSIIAFFYLLYS